MIAATIALTSALFAVPDAPPTITPEQVDPVVLCLNGRLLQTPNHALLLWAEKCYGDGNPQWKRRAAARAILGQAGAFTCKPTFYLPGNPHVDPQGGGWGNSWGVDRRLRRGDCAADRRYHHMGEVIVLAATGESMIVVDTGPGVRGPGRIDVCRTDEAEYRRDAARLGKRGQAWVVGRVTKREAR